MTRIRNVVALLRGQLWILPALLTASAAVLAYLMLRYGGFGMDDGISRWWLYSGDARTAGGLLSSFLSGLITMTSLIVSVTFVILTLAANQLGPRLISIFMADRQIQAVLGLFVGTILYVIIIFRTLDETLGSAGVPHLAVTVASILTVCCLLSLLFYVHKVARSIIADNVVAAAAEGLQRDLKGILSDVDEERDECEAAELTAGELTAALGRRSGVVALNRRGYIQVVDYGKLIEVASRLQVIVEVKVRAGHFVLNRGDHIIVHGGVLDEEARDAIRKAFVISSERTPAQDLEHGIRQLVEIAVRALSPGINDPFTAIAVIDRLGAAFEEIFIRPLQQRILRDEAGAARVIADRSDTSGLIDAAFDAIRQAGAEHPAILIRMADILGQLAPALESRSARDAVLRQLGKIEETARLANLFPSDREDAVKRIKEASAAILTGRDRVDPL